MSKADGKVKGRISAENLAEMKKMHNEGKSFAQIASKFNREEKTIENAIKGIKNTTSKKSLSAAEQIAELQKERAEIDAKIVALTQQAKQELEQKQAELQKQMASLAAVAVEVPAPASPVLPKA